MKTQKSIALRIAIILLIPLLVLIGISTYNKQKGAPGLNEDTDAFIKPHTESVIHAIDLNSILGEKDSRELISIAKRFVQNASEPGLEFDLIPVKNIGDWVIFEVLPKNAEVDPAKLFMQKTNGKWEGKAFGTAFPELEEMHPELFK